MLLLAGLLNIKHEEGSHGLPHYGAGTEYEESKMKPLGPGATIIVPANAPHYASAKDGETIVQEVGIGPSGTNVWPKAAAK
jgi:hypothetical protein